MASNFIPPIPIGQFKPSSEAIASWLYEIWKYLQENPIPAGDDVSDEATRVAQNYVTVNVPPMIASAIAALQYSDFVNGTTLPVYRASNDEIDNPDLLEAWAEGCRFALVDDEAFFIMIKNGETITLLQVLTEEQAQGVVSVNGQQGVVILGSDDIPNNSSIQGETISDALVNLGADISKKIIRVPQTGQMAVSASYGGGNIATANDARITSGHYVVGYEIPDTGLLTSNLMVTTSNGSVTVNGSCYSATTLVLYLAN